MFPRHRTCGMQHGIPLEDFAAIIVQFLLGPFSFFLCEPSHMTCAALQPCNGWPGELQLLHEVGTV